MNTTERIERPPILDSVTQRIETGHGKVYVRLGLDADHDVIEVFVTRGQSGGIMNGMTEALGKSLSNALRSGTDPEVLAQDLCGIRSDRIAHDNGDEIYSIPDAVGIAMLRYIHGKMGEPVREEHADET